MKLRNKIMTGTIVAAGILGPSFFNWACNRPAVEPNCTDKYGAYGAICPESIIIIRNSVDCITKDGTVRLTSGKEFRPEDGISGMKTNVKKIPGSELLEVSFTIAEGTTGHMKTVKCTEPEKTAP